MPGPDDMNPLSRVVFAGGEAFLRAMCRYHGYEVFGLENLPCEGPVLLLVNHSLATYDAFLIGVPINDRVGRLVRGLADRQIFRTPGLSRLFADMGFIEGTRDAAVELLQQGELVGVQPGGMRESLRISRGKYAIDWQDRRGFIWIAMVTGAPIVLAAGPRGDDIYRVYENPITPAVYQRLRLPLPIARGWGPSLLPRPVKLWHLVSEPIYPQVAPDRLTERDVEHHHARICERMHALMRESLALGPS